MNLKLKVGEHDVSVDAEPIEANVIQFTATCGGTTRRARMTMAPKHDHTAEFLQNDIRERAQLLAEEAAGHEQSRKLTSALFS